MYALADPGDDDDDEGGCFVLYSCRTCFSFSTSIIFTAFHYQTNFQVKITDEKILNFKSHLIFSSNVDPLKDKPTEILRIANYLTIMQIKAILIHAFRAVASYMCYIYEGNPNNEKLNIILFIMVLEILTVLLYWSIMVYV